MVRQEMARVNVNILGNSELKWTEMSQFNSDDHYIYYYGHESLRRNGVAIMVNKRVQNAVLWCNLKNDRMISVLFQSKSFSIMVTQVYALTSNIEEAKVEQFSEDLQDLLELTPKKNILFIMGEWNAKVGSQETQSNRQIWLWSAKWSREKANRVSSREHTGHSKHPLPTTQEKTLYMDITRWSTLKSDWLYSLQPKTEKFYTVSTNKTGIWLWLRSWTPYCQIRTEIEESRENHQTIQYIYSNIIS